MPSVGETKCLQDVLEANPVPTIITRMRDGLVKYANASVAELVGLPRENITGQVTPDFFVHPEERDAIMQELAKKSAVKNREIHCKKADGTPFWAVASFTAMNFDGEPSVMATIYDTTERKQAENALRSSERKYRALIVNSNDAIFIADADTGAIVDVNHRAEALIGLPRETLIGMHQSMLHPPEDAATYRERFRTRVVSGAVVSDDIVIQHSDGHTIPVNVTASRIEVEGRVLIQGVFRDMSERQKNLDALMAAEKKYHMLVDSVGALPWAYDIASDQFTFVGEQIRSMLGIGPDDMSSMEDWAGLIHPDDREKTVRYCQEATIRGNNHEIDYRMRSADGGWVWIRDTVTVKMGEDGPEELAGLIFDITKRKQAQAQLDRLNRTLRMMRDCNQALVRVSDEQTLLRDICDLIVSKGGYKMAWVGEAEYDGERRVIPLAQAGFEDGYLESAHISWADDKFGRGPLGRAIREGKAVVCQDVLHDPAFLPWRDQAVRRGYVSCAAFPLMIDGKIMDALTIYAPEREAFHADEMRLLKELAGDLAFGMEVMRHRREKEILEEQFRQAQKMEAIGILAGGIAHDFNNMLAGMLGTAYMVRKELQDHPELQRKLERVETTGFRAAKTISQLLTFARKGITDMQPVALIPFLKEAFKLARSSVPENTSFTLDVPESECMLLADAAMLQQILLNFVTNASHAIAEQTHPEIHISLEVSKANEALWERHPELPRKPYACLTVEDNGYGIPEKYLNKLFDPFFTTKEVGEGTGLGLAMAYGAVQSHDGVIEAESEEGKGSAFHVFLPLIEQTMISSQAAEGHVLEGHGETILLADDEDSVCEVSRELLESMGYRVLIAANGEEAVRLFGEHQDEIRLAILDVVMPQMGGVDAALQIREPVPDLPILFQTGYGKEQVLGKIEHLKHCRVVTKPAAIPELSRILNEMLEGGS